MSCTFRSSARRRSSVIIDRMKIIRLPFKVKSPILACGADLKGAFALAKGDKAYLVEGFGDLSDPACLRRYERSVKAHEERLGIKPQIIACDHHPGYFSTRFAEMHGLSLLAPSLCDVQHHEAHVASAIIDNGIKTDVIGVAFDGTGLGWDGCMWGGEFLIGGAKKFKRAAHFEYVPMPGGQIAISQPWRMAVSYLYRAFDGDLPRQEIRKIWKIDGKQIAIIKRIIDGGLNSPLTSSAGRLFDGAASLVLKKSRSALEAELPIALEKLAARGCNDRYEFTTSQVGGMHIVKIGKLFKGIIGDINKKKLGAFVSAKFHNTIAWMMADTVCALRRRCGLNTVVLSGGVFQNRYLVRNATALIVEQGFKVYTHSNINTNDSGIPIGQIAIANARKRCV